MPAQSLLLVASFDFIVMGSQINPKDFVEAPHDNGNYEVNSQQVALEIDAFSEWGCLQGIAGRCCFTV